MMLGVLLPSSHTLSFFAVFHLVQNAKWVGDLFNKGFNEIQIELKKTPFLEWESPDQMERCVPLLCYVYLHVEQCPAKSPL